MSIADSSLPLAATIPFCGTHVLGEIHQLSFDILNDGVYLTQLLREAVGIAGATVCGDLSKAFEPQGVTILFLLEESHASIHTFPEAGSLFLDIFTCGERCKPALAFEHVRAALKSDVFSLQQIVRGARAV